MVVLTDPRQTVREYFDKGHVNCKVNSAVLVDEDGVQLDYEASYEKPMITLLAIFQELGKDVVFNITDRGTAPLHTPSGNIGTAFNVGVQPVLLDKWSADGSVSVVATKILHLIEQEVKRVINENCVGSYRLLENVSPTTQQLSPTLAWGTLFEVTYTQYVSAFGTYTVPNRRFYNDVREWRVGVNAGTYSAVGYASGLGPVSWLPDDPWVKQKIPGGSLNVFQTIGGYSIRGRMQVRDYEAVTQLLKTVDVSSSGGTQTAVSSFARNTIGYFAIVVDNTKIVNTTDGRTAATSTYVFANARIAEEPYPEFDQPGSPWTVEWYADYCTQTDV